MHQEQAGTGTRELECYPGAVQTEASIFDENASRVIRAVPRDFLFLRRQLFAPDKALI